MSWFERNKAIFERFCLIRSLIGGYSVVGNPLLRQAIADGFIREETIYRVTTKGSRLFHEIEQEIKEATGHGSIHT